MPERKLTKYVGGKIVPLDDDEIAVFDQGIAAHAERKANYVPEPTDAEKIAALTARLDAQDIEIAKLKGA